MAELGELVRKFNFKIYTYFAQGQTAEQLAGDWTGIKCKLDSSVGKVEVRVRPIC